MGLWLTRIAVRYVFAQRWLYTISDTSAIVWEPDIMNHPFWGQWCSHWSGCASCPVSHWRSCVSGWPQVPEPSASPVVDGTERRAFGRTTSADQPRSAWFPLAADQNCTFPGTSLLCVGSRPPNKLSADKPVILLG